ncbi:MAG: cysteine--tRNA ligase [Firmicutes bacterium]|nr:cysteine--tRNA ligase [Bacillota bacterium]
MAIKIHNTLTRRKEEFAPVTPGKVGIYSCGPTVYDYFHIGNARAFVVPDVIRRYLRYKGYDVTLVQNITDIEDKIIKRAAERGVAPQDIVDEFTEAYIEDREALGVQTPDIQPRATAHVGDMIQMIQTLIDNGLAYAKDGDVYYDVSKFEHYGILSNQKIDDLMAGARVNVGEAKEDPLDFTLWKAAKPGEPSWDSPWGPGRPGWHIECSVMSTKYLGKTFDIHTGGVDLVFPHHENEIAQSHGANGVAPVKYWVHNGYINVDGEKMAKSLGNFKTVRDILKQYPGKVVRYFLISNHYRKPINFSDDELRMCEKALARLEDAIANAIFAASIDPDDIGAMARLAARGTRGGGEDGMVSAEDRLDVAITEVRGRFEESMDDDFNTAGAIASLHDLATALNTYVNRQMPSPPDEGARAAVSRAVLAIMELGDVLGIMDSSSMKAAGVSTGPGSDDQGEAAQLGETVRGLVQLLLDVRAKAREAKEYGVSDMIRDRLAEMGIVVEDTRDGARWKFESK